MKSDDNIVMSNTPPIAPAPRARAQAGDRQLEPRLGALCEARSRVDREGDRDGDQRRAVAGVLDPKTIELIGIALDVSCTHMYAPGVRRHVQRALKAGATREEITAVLQLASLQGLHSMCLGAPILLEEVETTSAPSLTSSNPNAEAAWLSQGMSPEEKSVSPGSSP